MVHAMDTYVSVFDLVLLALVIIPSVLSAYLAYRVSDIKNTVLKLSESASNHIAVTKNVATELEKTDNIVVDIIQHIERTDAIINSIAGDVIAVDQSGDVGPFDGTDGE